MADLRTRMMRLDVIIQLNNVSSDSVAYSSCTEGKGTNKASAVFRSPYPYTLSH